MHLNTNLIGKVLLRFAELESTQTYAQELLARTVPEEGTLVAASYQRAGKGLLRNRWESEPGKNLLFSLILYPGFLPLGRAFLFSQTMALGVRDWVGLYLGDRARIKWPNDIYIDEGKVAGMLIQNSLSGSLIQHSVVGIGINVNQTDFPAGLPNPVSMKAAAGRDFDLEECLSGLCQRLEHWYLRLKDGNRELIGEEYLRHLYGLGEWRTFADREGSRFQGRISGVAENGYLLVDTAEGLRSFEAKELRFVFAPPSEE